MKIYQTNAALGHRQLAYIIELDKSKNGFNYLCIGTQNVNDGSYYAGKLIEDLEDFYLEETTYTVEESPLYGTYLFDFFMSKI